MRVCRWQRCSSSWPSAGQLAKLACQLSFNATFRRPLGCRHLGSLGAMLAAVQAMYGSTTAAIEWAAGKAMSSNHRQGASRAVLSALLCLASKVSMPSCPC